MACSKKTLTRFLPILAAGSPTIETRPREPEEVVRAAVETAGSIRQKIRYTLGSPDPQRIDRLPAMSGKVTPLFIALRPFVHT